MKTLRSILSILLVVLFIPSPTVWANSVSSAMRARNAAAAAGAAASNPSAPAGGTTSAGSQAYSMAQEAHRRARVAADAMDQMRRAQIEARLISAPTPNPNRPGQTLPGVPDGVGSGGLDALNPENWIGAVRHGNGDRWIVETKDGRQVVTIRQDAAQALLTWRSFNIGKNTTLYFDQRAGGGDSANWTAFNFLGDSSTAPSQILGQIKAEGQVYVVNPNGIIFGNNSQVDVRGLTASTLPINRHLIEGGLLNNPDAQFLFSGLSIPAGTNGAPAFTPPAPPSELGRYGNVLVMAGAQLRSTISAEGNGGRIMLVGPNVENHGTISTPGGQTILAAGLQVGVAAHASSDASLRGLDVFVGAVDANSGYVLNKGLIESAQGNTTMVGKTVEMSGIIASSTSVSLNGRIDLIAAYDALANPLKSNVTGYSPFLNRQSGTVLIGADSLLTILPEITSTEKVAATELALRSQLNIRGKDIYFGERSMLLVPSGIINANAGIWRTGVVNANPVSEFINADGQIYLEKDVLISAAGTTDVYIPLSQVLLTVELRGSELADSPVQRDDILRGETITVDIRNRGTLNGVDWVGSPLADVSGYLGLIERTVAELTINGGTVNLNAGGTVVMQKGSQVDVSGGFARYQGGVVETTALYKNGRIISIADALPNVSYDGILSRQVSESSVRWANRHTYSRSQMIGANSYQDTYIDGAAGGSLSLTASAMALDGELRGSVVVGDRQRVRVPDYASLLLAFETRDAVSDPNQAPVIAPNAPSITFVNGEAEAPVVGSFVAGQGKGGAALPTERVKAVELSAELLSEGGFGNVTVRNRGGSITVDNGVTIAGQTKGALKLEGANVTVNGTIAIAGGLIDLSAYNISYETINAYNRSNQAPNPQPASDRGKVLIGSTGRLDVAGKPVVDARDAVSLVPSYAIDGGKVSVRGYETELRSGSVIDVSGGAHLSTTGKLSYGNGGAIVLEGGRDLVMNSVIDGSLVIDGTLEGYAGGRGGSLSLLVPVIEVGNGGSYAGMLDDQGNPLVNSLVLGSDFFNKGGFSDFTVRGIGTTVMVDKTNPGTGAITKEREFIAGVRIDTGAKINPKVEGRIARIDGSGLRLDAHTYDEGVRNPGSLTFGATGANDSRGAAGQKLLARSEVVMEQGAAIKTDAGGRVSFNANAISLHGKVETPGGSITVTGGDQYDLVIGTHTTALTTVFIGKTAKLLATGALVDIYDAQGLKHGKVHGGGVITLEGNIVAEAGAVLDVSGISAGVDMLDIYNPDGPVRQHGQGTRGYTTMGVDSSGGTIRLKGSEMLVSEATLRGAAGGKNASGGTLEISSGRFYAASATESSTADITLSVLQGGSLLGGGEKGVGQKVELANGVLSKDGVDTAGRGFFTIESFEDLYVYEKGKARLERGGFDNLTLAGNVEFVNNKVTPAGGNGVAEKKMQIDARGIVHVASGGVLTSRSIPVEGEAAGLVPTIEINAKHVVIGQDLALPTDPSIDVWHFTKTIDDGSGEKKEEHRITPTSASGRLLVNADSIDIGTLVLDRLSSADLIASDKGSIRGSGHLSIAGDITLKAGQIHPTTATGFSIIAADYVRNQTTGQMEARGRSVTFLGGDANLGLPYSAGGTLSVYGGEIRQDGVLRSPFGIINLGWDGTGTAPLGAVSGLAMPVASSVTLGGTSVTSVSGVGPDGKGIVLPYGILRNGISWIDPRGVDITHGGLPQKQVNISGKDVTTVSGSQIDLRGGGDLFAYRWVPGVGGSRDVLSLPGSFAVVPGYNAPAEAPYNPDSVEGTLGTDKGYTDSNLKVGDRIYLSGNSGLAAGYYTLLPARYALMDGAFLVTPQSGDPFGNGSSILMADGSHLVSGYRVNGFSGNAQDGRILSRFEVASRKVVMERAQYDIYSANDFLASAAADRGVAAPRLPGDSGQVVFTASESMALNGALATKALGKGRGSLVDINSALDIIIGNSAGSTGKLHLDVDALNAFSAASLLIGGVRNTADGYAVVSANSGSVTVDNAGSPLIGSDIILVGRNSVALAEGAQITSVAAEGAPATAELIRVGGTNQSGDGALVRVSAAREAAVERINVTDTNTAQLSVGKGVQIRGGSVTLDSSSQTHLDPQVQLLADTLNLGSGRISLVLDDAATLPANGGLVLSGSTLDSILSSVRSLGLSSYSSIDVYGGGTVGAQSVEQIALNAPVLRAYQTNGGQVQFSASTLLLGNTTGTVGQTGTLPADGTVRFDAGEVRLGSGVIGVDGFTRTTINARDAVRIQNEGGLSVAGDLHISTPAIAAARAAKHTLYASGDFLLERGNSGAVNTAVQSDVGASLVIDAQSVALRSNIVLPSGKVDVRSRAGDITLGSADGMRIDVSGSSRNIYDRPIGTDAGSVQLTALGGNVVAGAGSLIDVTAGSDKNRVGSVGVSAVDGALILNGGTFNAGENAGGVFTLDALRLADASGNSTTSIGALDAFLNQSGFGGSRSYRLRSGDVVVDGVAKAHHYALATDAGSVRVSGKIDASGATGGQIELRAANDVVIENGGVLSVVADDFSNAGKGGKVFLEAGSLVNGNINRDARVRIEDGSLIDLMVKVLEADNETEMARLKAENAAKGKHSGVLHLRAARNLAGTDFGVDVIAGAVRGASHIAAEGFEVYDLSSKNGVVDKTVRDLILNEGKAFLGAVGGNMDNYDAMLKRISGGNAELAEQIVLQVGAEIVNASGDLMLGTADSRALTFWDLSGYRFGARSSAGVLTLRAAGDIGIYDALSDGFMAPAANTDIRLSELAIQNAKLPTNAQSWSYRIVSGADLSAADFRQTLATEDLAAGKGSLLVGRDAPPVSGSSTDTLVYGAQHYRYQVIRTGSGDIDIVSGRDVRLLNPFATIYTAGTRVANPTHLYFADDFFMPKLVTTLGALPLNNLAPGTSIDSRTPTYQAQYSLSGGDVSIAVGGDIGRYIRDNNGKLYLDTSRQLPNNWLYRRGHVDSTGEYGSVTVRQGTRNYVTDTDASTTWWIDFSNFFQGVGALGGGNVSLVAGNDIINVDAVVPTNARAPMGVPDASKIIELGGGDLLVQAGRNIDGGIYYVERGQGSLLAGNSIKTNEARSISLGNLGSGGIANPARLAANTWMPTTLFLGKGSFDVSATGDVLLGSVANTFLLPQGLGNRYWYKTYFSTYAPDSEVRVSSTAGDITLRGEVTLPTATGLQSFIQAWLAGQNQQTNAASAATLQPWLRLAETDVVPFGTLSTVMPPALRMTAYSGDINVSGSFNLFPSRTGTLDVVAAGSINALNPNGMFTQSGRSVIAWNNSRINVSDANPNFLPGVTSPLSYYGMAGETAGNNNTTDVAYMPNIARFFDETGATNTVLQTKLELHSADLLHRNDKEPVYLYAGSGDISGLTLYSPKQTRVIAGRDITNISFYMQNLAASDSSLIIAGRDIVAYDANSERRLSAISSGNAFNTGVVTALGGDIQLGGPGALQVIAGRNLNLGIGPSGENGLSSGVTTIGNRRNPFLSGEGADIIAGAGIGPSIGLGSSDLDFAVFVSLFLNASSASKSEVAVHYQDSLKRILGLDRKGMYRNVRDLFDAESLPRQIELARAIYQQARANGDIDPSTVAEPVDAVTLAAFTSGYLNPEAYSDKTPGYLGSLQAMMGVTDGDITWAVFNRGNEQERLHTAFDMFYAVLRDVGRDYNNPESANYRKYDNGYLAIKTLFPQPAQTGSGNGEDAPSRWSGNISLTSRQFKTAAGGDISLFAPGGGVVVGFPVADARADQGILTEAGGNISIFTHNSVEVGSSRIFTLRGGDISIWSSEGDIAAGSAAKTVRSAPPTRVIIDSQTASVLTDLSGLATGGGIGALQTVKDAAASDIDLIAPRGTVDAGDAGIRVSGNVNIAAEVVLNATNISSGGSAAGVPPATTTVANMGGLNAASAASQAATATMDSSGGARSAGAENVIPSIFSIEVLGYGEEDEEDKRSAQSVPAVQEQAKSKAPLI